MLFAFMLLAAVADWVPMRWPWADPKSLDLLKGTPINCLLLEAGQWSIAGAKPSATTLGIIRPSDSPAAVAKAAAAGLSGIVLQGDFEEAAREELLRRAAEAKLAVIELPSRARLRFDREIVGTYQGVWPGIQTEEEASTRAAPSGAPWIYTNSGFLRFARALTSSPVWIANEPPAGHVITGTRYQQAFADAALAGARWVIALDADFAKRLLSGDAAAVKDWNSLTRLAAYFESNTQWRSLQPAGDLALVQDADTGALFSGGVLDMLAVKHTPVRPIPSRKLGSDALNGAKMAVNVVPSALSAEQIENLRNFTRRGGTLLSGPPSWKFPATTADRITLDEKEVEFLDDAWRDVNSMTGRRNLGVRLFNVSSMLSNLLRAGDGKLVVHLLNYSGYPVENVTVHTLGKFKSATVLSPGAPPKRAETYETDEGTGIDIASVDVFATLIVE